MYGEAKVSLTTEKWLEEWWDNYNRTDGFQNKAQELIPYYARKNINVKKLTMCRWFGEHADIDSYGRPRDEIPLEAFQETIAFLEKEEKNMHLALRLEGNSKHCKATQKIIDMLQSGKKNFVDLYIACQKHIDSRADLEEALSFLVETRQIDTKVEADPITNKEITYYVKI
jgi:di/tripeptidase